MEIEPLITASARGFELAGVLVLLAGAFIASFVCLRRMWAGMPFQEAYGALRADLGVPSCSGWSCWSSPTSSVPSPSNRPCRTSPYWR